MIMTRSRGALNASMRAKVEIELGGMGDDIIHGSTGGNVSRSSHLILRVGAEETGVVTLLNNHKGYAWHVIDFQLQTGLANSA